MRRLIIDSDLACDDAAAIIMASKCPDVEILGVTTVAGTVDVHQTTQNVLMTLEVCGCPAGVYMGASKPYKRARRELLSINGKDNMGDCGLIHPTRKAEEQSAISFILEMVAKYPNEVEIVSLAQVTNLALAIEENSQVMSKVKRIWSMATPGLGLGNATPVAECNVFSDAESYEILLNAGIPTTIIGFDVCLGENELTEEALMKLANTSPEWEFIKQASSKLASFNEENSGRRYVNLPDAVAMACALYPWQMLETVDCRCKVCTTEEATYGQVIFYQKGIIYEGCSAVEDSHIRLVRKVGRLI